MLKVKSNYKIKYKNNLICRACGLAEETQDHVMQECTKLHQNDTNKVTPEMIFTENTTQLIQIAHRIDITMNHLDTYTKPSGAPAQSGGSAQLPAQSDGVPQITGRPAP